MVVGGIQQIDLLPILRKLESRFRREVGIAEPFEQWTWKYLEAPLLPLLRDDSRITLQLGLNGVIPLGQRLVVL
jgi:hypothetical protein